jgi:purine nucleoside permease
MGDVFLITVAVDYDLGHHADARELSNPDGTTWFHDAEFDDAAVVRLNPELMDKVYALAKDTPVETTEVTRNNMRAAFDGADWAVRDPKVLRGTTVTGDNYWKGQYGHLNAVRMTEVYQCPDPYATTEMEDVAVARTVERMGMLDRLIMIRVSVNMDVFMLGTTPESLWRDASADTLVSEESVEAADIFMTAMKNNFDVGRNIIDRILTEQF